MFFLSRRQRFFALFLCVFCSVYSAAERCWNQANRRKPDREVAGMPKGGLADAFYRDHWRGQWPHGV
ncbi:hypothetical protein BBB56_16675 [Candidatus Pantoea deserta]|uniref:Secreted protein n=1 Tax=Candidatus Pantoea deserta TaxID=1869313 RepID=A0A3N4NZW9_9GAMM|nr:hypothetical protein BBB56_16675 [Pantoea deserta]